MNQQLPLRLNQSFGTQMGVSNELEAASYVIVQQETDYLECLQ